jgi:hypothetical protein
MIQWYRRRHLSATRTACSDLMAISTRQLLRSIVTGVTKSYAISRCLFSDADETSELMTGTARRDVAAIYFCLRRVTAKARDVGIQSRWN